MVAIWKYWNENGIKIYKFVLGVKNREKIQTQYLKKRSNIEVIGIKIDGKTQKIF